MKLPDKKKWGTRFHNVIKKPAFWLFMIISIMFAILYARFIFGNYAYTYLDTGSDTFLINYPLYYLFQDVFSGGGGGDYFLNAGLGADMSSWFYQYLNPLNLMVILLPRHLLPWAILLASYFKLLIIGFFGYGFFKRLVHSSYGGFGAALIWTFSGYVMLWGQHYGFCMSMALFTVFMYLVHRNIARGEKSLNVFLVLMVTLMLISNYYFLYMTGIFAALYVVIYMGFTGERPLAIVANLVELALMGLLGICMGGVCLIPTLNSLMESSRSAGSTSLSTLLHPYSSGWLYGFLARFFSLDTLGIAEDYTGEANYFEIAALSSSALVLPSLAWLLRNKKTRIKTAVLCLVSVLLLILPITGQLLTFNAWCVRWSFVITFMMAASAGYMLKVYIKKRKDRDARKDYFYSFLSALLVMLLAYVLLLFGGKDQGYDLYYKKLILYAAFLIIYWLLISLRKAAWAPLGILAVLCIELCIMNWPAINQRISPTRSQVASEYYNDGTEKASMVLAARDTGVYRSEKAYQTILDNQGMAQGYAGFSGYSTVNSRSLVELKKLYGGDGISDSTADFSDNFLFQLLMGLKYQYVNSLTHVSAQGNTYQFTVPGIDVYRYDNSLPFGYLYTEEWNASALDNMTTADRTRALLYGYFETDGQADTRSALFLPEQTDKIALTEKSLENVDCTSYYDPDDASLTISQMGADPYIIISDIEGDFSSSDPFTFYLEADVDQSVSMALYYKRSPEDEYSTQGVYTFTLTPEDPTWSAILQGGIYEIRLDIDTPLENIRISKFEAAGLSVDQEAYDALKNSQVEGISFENDTYQADVHNTGEENEMLCIPILYTSGWTASIDGTEAELHNINGGLCGISIPPGDHQVTMTYRQPHKKAGIIMTGAGWLVFAGWLIMIRKRHSGFHHKEIPS